jgi:hypothetical protein
MAEFEEERLIRPLFVMEKVEELALSSLGFHPPENWRLGPWIVEVRQIYESRTPTIDRIRKYSEMSNRLKEDVDKRRGEGVPQKILGPLVYALKAVNDIVQLLEKKTELE